MDTVLNRRAADKGSSVESDKITQNPPEVVGDPRGWEPRRGTRTIELETLSKKKVERALRDWGKGRLGASARAVLREIVDAGDAPEYCPSRGVAIRESFLRRRTIADRLGRSPRTVDRALGELNLAGVLAWQRFPGGSNRYVVLVPDEAVSHMVEDTQPEVEGARECRTQSVTVSGGVRHGDAPYTKTKYQSQNTNPNPRRDHGSTRPPHDDNPGEGGDEGEVFRILIQEGVKKHKAQAIADSGCVTVAQVHQLVEDMRARSDIKNRAGWLAWACENAVQALEASPHKAKRKRAGAIEDAYRQGVDVDDRELRSPKLPSWKGELAQMRDDGKLDNLAAFTLQTIRKMGYGYAELIDAEAWHERGELVYRVDPCDGTPEGDRFAVILANGHMTMVQRAERRPAQTLTINPG